MRVLITGGAGFVGQQVAACARARGHEAVVSDRSAAPVSLDVLDAAAVSTSVAQCDVIVHCAAVVGPEPARQDPLQAVRVNVAGTAHVLDAARRHGRRVVCLSTATLYGTRPDLQPLRETDVPEPVSHYDATKLAAEVICRSYRQDFDVDVVLVRTGFVYGPGHSTGEYFVEAALRGEAITQENGAAQPCDFTYVKDLATGLVQAAEHAGLPQPVYNVTGGVLRTRAEFADAVRARIREADITIGPGYNPAMHLRGPCVLELARRDFSYESRYSVEAGVADWVAAVTG